MNQLDRDLEEAVRLAWAKACNWDGIHHRSSFVVFSSDNPYAQEYNDACAKFSEHRGRRKRSRQ